MGFNELGIATTRIPFGAPSSDLTLCLSAPSATAAESSPPGAPKLINPHLSKKRKTLWSKLTSPTSDLRISAKVSLLDGSSLYLEMMKSLYSLYIFGVLEIELPSKNSLREIFSFSWISSQENQPVRWN